MNNKTKAITLMLLSALSFALMQIFIALTADSIPLFQQLFFRNLVASLIAVVAIRKKHLSYFGQPKNRKLLLMRSVFGYLGMITTFYATGIGNQGDVTTIIKMSPFVVTILAFVFLKETITKYQIIGLLVSFVGVYFVSNPQFTSDVWPLVVAGISCVFSGAAYTLVGALKGKEPPEVIIFFFSLSSTVVTLPIMMTNWVTPTMMDGILLIFIGAFAGLGQITLTYAYTFAKASEVSIYNYSGILFSTLLGYLFLGQAIKPTSILGSALVITAGLIVFVGNSKLEKQ